jgi:hypothetical protein
VLDWNPQGSRKRGGRTWREVKRLTADRGPWKPLAPTQETIGNDDEDTCFTTAVAPAHARIYLGALY